MPIKGMSAPFRNLLAGVSGNVDESQGGLSDAIWGQSNINDARFQEAADRNANRGKPGMGFLNTSKYGTPGIFDRYHGLMMGLRDGALMQGKNFQQNEQPNRPSILGRSRDTRFDGDQVGVNTGRTLTEDTYGDDAPGMKIPMYQLRQMYGLK